MEVLTEPKLLVDKYYANIYSSLPVVLSKGKGVYVWDNKGNKYFDCLSCYSAVNQGHRHPKIIKAAKKQMGRLTLTSMAFYNDKLGKFLEMLYSITSLPKIILKNSGAEGVETAIKAMRKWGRDVKQLKDPSIIVMNNNFHGRTTTIIGFSSNPKTKKGFGPYCSGFISVPYGDIDAFKKALDSDAGIAGALIEPIQGEAGVIIPPNHYLHEIYLACKKRGVLLAIDEIQTGLGRTGFMFYHKRTDFKYMSSNGLVVIRPDILILGKALSGGVYPISACCMTKKVGEVFEPETDGSTYGGNPLAAVIGKAALEVILKEGLCENSMMIGQEMLNLLKIFSRDHCSSVIKEVRGKGLFIAIEFWKPIAKKVSIDLIKKGILVKDTHDVIIRIAPPLVLTRKEMLEIVGRLEEYFNGL